MIDLKFIQFYVESLHNKSVEEYFHVERSTVSNWRKRGMPKRYLLTFIDMEKSDDIFDLFERIYQKNNKNEMTENQKYTIDILVEIKTNRCVRENEREFRNDNLKGMLLFGDILRRLKDYDLIERLPNYDYILTKNGEDVVKDNTLISKYF